MTLRFDGLWLALISVVAFMLCGCGNAGTAKTPTTSTTSRSTALSVDGTGGTISTQTPIPVPTATASALSAPLRFEVTGIGNHARHICVPATKKLYLRIKPVANWAPLTPPYPYGMTPAAPTYTDKTYVYDGTPAYYNTLKVRLSIPDTAAAWDYKAELEKYSVAGDYSNYLRAVPEASLPNDAALALPEYKDVWIFGSSPFDGACTYWEKTLGKCSEISNALRVSEVVSCAAGYQKIMITKIASDYGCTTPLSTKTSWCAGGPIQYVPDYQPWNVVIEAVTENTTNFTQ